MSGRVLFTAAVLMTSGCGAASSNGLELRRGVSAKDLAQADEVARRYLRAAAEADAERLCAARTNGALRELGGRAACLDKPRPLIGLRLSVAELRRAEVLPVQTSGEGVTAAVMADYGRATIKSGMAVSGKAIAVELRREKGRYKVSRAGVATFIGDME